MKKLIYVAALAVSGLTVISCDAESIQNVTKTSNAQIKQTNDFSLSAKVEDTIIVQTEPVEEPGPGDEVVPIKPPTKP